MTESQSEKDPFEGRRIANLVPGVARMVLGLAEDRGISPERLCRGLGLSPQDLTMPDVLVSHQQTRALILRAQRMLDEPALGLAVGARETPVSWGLAGLAMLTCETLGEAVHYGLERQTQTGSLLEHHVIADGQRVHLSASPRLFDLEIEAFLVEEAFAGSVAVVRAMVGPGFRPLQVDLAYPSGDHHRLYERFFRCPVRFQADEHRLTIEAKWLQARLPGHDRITSGLVRQQLNRLLQVPIGQDDLIESVANRLRYGLQDAPRQEQLASLVNVSERTLRRRLEQRDTSFRALRDSTRLERARDLLANTTMTISEVAQALGYADARSFRRAFKRWTGQLPTSLRDG
ncbi:AraC family transcriptional regulator [Roseateles sp. UC29_93]|uniref:AraC family transcriptional regulator n=1 Tax=Roseateles sp. UC29_93 TaxID=3350177 RepID=UPI00366C6124